MVDGGRRTAENKKNEKQKKKIRKKKIYISDQITVGGLRQSLVLYLNFLENVWKRLNQSITSYQVFS